MEEDFYKNQDTNLIDLKLPLIEIKVLEFNGNKVKVYNYENE